MWLIEEQTLPFRSITSICGSRANLPEIRFSIDIGLFPKDSSW
jgi:hypothetical protein